MNLLVLQILAAMVFLGLCVVAGAVFALYWTAKGEPDANGDVEKDGGNFDKQQQQTKHNP
jgi:hypothetical protein